MSLEWHSQIHDNEAPRSEEIKEFYPSIIAEEYTSCLYTINKSRCQIFEKLRTIARNKLI